MHRAELDATRPTSRRAPHAGSTSRCRPAASSTPCSPRSAPSRTGPEPCTTTRSKSLPPEAAAQMHISSEDFWKTYKKENPNVKTIQEVGKACGEKWNTMAFEP